MKHRLRLAAAQYQKTTHYDQLFHDSGIFVLPGVYSERRPSFLLRTTDYRLTLDVSPRSPRRIARGHGFTSSQHIVHRPSSTVLQFHSHGHIVGILPSQQWRGPLTPVDREGYWLLHRPRLWPSPWFDELGIHILLFEAAEFALCYGPDSLLALLRTFTFELAPSGSPREGVEYNYVGTQPIPTTGLAPVGPTALWAAPNQAQANAQVI